MTKGRNSTTITIRVPDEMYFWLKDESADMEMTIARYIKWVLTNERNRVIRFNESMEDIHNIYEAYKNDYEKKTI